ncbi:hypothetical protein GWK47_003638 [Chionoecetes opilio]|uniref:Uncharacterized protein n=1 Tax=Chionoecetes opilio TaxID=41210 RepID=A0A8J4YWG7_CHIOP|nr:hypothetical protein GWK47_003638 [Chionoecetes opilio]
MPNTLPDTSSIAQPTCSDPMSFNRLYLAQWLQTGTCTLTDCRKDKGGDTGWSSCTRGSTSPRSAWSQHSVSAHQLKMPITVMRFARQAPVNTCIMRWVASISPTLAEDLMVLHTASLSSPYPRPPCVLHRLNVNQREHTHTLTHFCSPTALPALPGEEGGKSHARHHSPVVVCIKFMSCSRS